MYSNDVVLEDNLLRRNSVGVYFMYSSGMVLRHNVIVGNRGPSGYGIGLKDTNAYLLDSNLIAGNRTGIYLDNSPSERTGDSRIWRNTISGNDVGAAFLPSVRGNVIYENAFLDNMEQVAVLGRGSWRTIHLNATAAATPGATTSATTGMATVWARNPTRRRRSSST